MIETERHQTKYLIERFFVSGNGTEGNPYDSIIGGLTKNIVVAMITISESRPGSWFIITAGCKIQLDTKAKLARFKFYRMRMSEQDFADLKQVVESCGYSVTFSKSV